MKAPHLADVVYHLNHIFRPGPKIYFDQSNVQNSPTYQGALTISSTYFLMCCFIFCGIVLCIWGWNPAGQQAPWASMLDSMTGGNGCQLKLYQVLEMKHDRRETDGKERSCEKRPTWRHGVTHTHTDNRDKLCSQAIGTIKVAHWRSRRSRTDAFKSPNFYTCFSCLYFVQNILNDWLGLRPNAMCPIIKKKCISCVVLSVETL